MKKFIYFIPASILCFTMVTACTNSETKSEQAVINSEELVKEIDTNKDEENEKRVPVELDGEYFVIDREVFTNLFNSTENLENIEEWNKDDTDDEELETYYTVVSDTVIELLKEKESEKYLGILVNSYCDTIEDLDKISQIPITICSLCENPFPITDSFLDDTTNAVYDTFNTGEKQYVYGKKGVFCYSYDNGVMSFFAVPPMEEEQTSIKNNEKTEKATNETATDSSTPTEQEIEIYNYINDLLEIGADTSQEPSVSEIVSYLGVSEETVNGNYNAYKQSYLEHTYEDYCDKLTSEKYGISIDEVNEIWLKVYSYENKNK